MTAGGQPLPTLALSDAPESLTTRNAIWLEPPDAALAVDRLRLAERALVRIIPGRSMWHLPFVDPLAVVLIRVQRSYDPHGAGPEVRLALPTFARTPSPA